MQTQPTLRVAIAVDAALLAAGLGLAYWVGQQANEIDRLRYDLRTRGAPAISIEADQRLTLVEERQKNVLRRLERLENK